MLSSSNTIHYHNSLHSPYHMVTENHEVLYLDDVRGVHTIVILDELQNLQFHKCLVEELLFAPDDLQRCLLLPLMVEYFQHGPERALSELVRHLIPVRDMVIYHVQILTPKCWCQSISYLSLSNPVLWLPG
jgi:hypothetical protein